MAIFPGEPGLAGCPLILLLHLFLDFASFWDRPKLSMSFLTQSHQVFFGHPLCLIPLTSHVIQCLTQSLSSFRSTCPNHLNLLFWIIKLTGSNHGITSITGKWIFISRFVLHPCRSPTAPDSIPTGLLQRLCPCRHDSCGICGLPIIDPLHFLADCHERQLNQALSVICLSTG